MTNNLRVKIFENFRLDTSNLRAAVQNLRVYVRVLYSKFYEFKKKMLKGLLR